MPSIENPPQKRQPLHEYYLRIGQFILAFSLAWLIMTATIKVTDTMMVLLLFFIVAGILIIATARRMPQDNYFVILMKKIFYPLLTSTLALMTVAALTGIPLLSFGIYMGHLPLLFVVTLALEALI